MFIVGRQAVFTCGAVGGRMRICLDLARQRPPEHLSLQIPRKTTSNSIFFLAKL